MNGKLDFGANLDRPIFLLCFIAPHRSHDGANTMQTGQEYLTEREAAALLNVSVKKLQSDRCKRIGAPFCRFGKAVRYHAETLRQWAQARSVVAAE